MKRQAEITNKHQNNTATAVFFTSLDKLPILMYN